MLTIQHKNTLSIKPTGFTRIQATYLNMYASRYVSQTENIRKSEFEIEFPVIKFVTYVT